MTRLQRIVSMFLAIIMVIGLLPLSVIAEDIQSTHTVHFKLNYNGAHAIPSQKVADGARAVQPEDITREGWIFQYWYEKTSTGEVQKFDLSQPITKDMTLYARWDEDIEYWGPIWNQGILGAIEDDGDGEEDEEDTIAETSSELSSIANINDGVLPDIYLAAEDNLPQFISGKYSDIIVTDYDSAILSINDIKNIMSIDLSNSSFMGIDISERNGVVFYKLQQLYRGYPVYGKQVIVATDTDGHITSLSADYDVIGNIETTPVVSEDEAQHIASESVEYKIVVDGELIVYPDADNSCLAWLFSDINYDILINALTGEYITRIDNTYAALRGTANVGDVTVSFPVVLNDGMYWIIDEERNIFLYSANNSDPEDKDRYKKYTIIENSSNSWKLAEHTSAAALYRNLSIVYDFYLDELGLVSFDGLGSTINGAVNEKTTGEIAHSTTIKGNQTIISIESKYTADEIYSNIDIIGHEYTHSVENSVSSMRSRYESGAIKEAYSDFMGELIEESSFGEANWMFSDVRSLCDPTSKFNLIIDGPGGDQRFVYPERYKGKGYYVGKQDCGGIHHNSTVISHALYEVYQDSGLSINAMSELLYHTLYYLPQESTFSQYYNAIYQSALDLGLNYITSDIMRAFITEADIIMGDNINDVNWYNGEIQIGGRVYESILGYPVNNISVEIRAGKDNTTGAYMDLENTSSYRNGFTYTVNNPGFYTVEIVSDGYYIKHQTIVASISRDASDIEDMLGNIVKIDPYPVIKGKVTQPLGNVSVKVFKSDVGVIAQQKRDKIIDRAYQWYNLTWSTTQDMALYNGKTLPAKTLIRGLPYSCKNGRVSNTIDGIMIGSKNYFKDLSNDAKYKNCYGADCTEFVLDCLWHGDPAIGSRSDGIFTRNTKEITDWTEIQPGDIFRRTGDKAHVIVIVDVDDNGTPEYPADDRYTCMECQSYELGEKQPDGTYMTGMLNHTYTYNAIRTGKNDNWTSGGYKPYRYTAIDDVKPEYETITDQNGNYSLSMLDGDYIIVFSAVNYYDKTIEISVSEDTSIPDITLTPMSAATFSVTHSNNGSVTDILAASPVKMYNGAATQTWTINSTADWTVTKSGDWFTLDKTSGKAGETTLKINIANGTDSQNSGSITFAVGDTTYKVDLVQTASHLKGWIVAGLNQPINGAVVTVSDGRNSWNYTTGTNGVFDITVPNATYTISVTADGYESKSYDHDVQVNSEDVDVGEILLTKSILSLTGTIKDGDSDSATYGQVLEGVSFTVYDAAGKKVGNTVKSDKDGVVAFDFPAADTYTFVFSLIGYQTVTVDAKIINENTLSLGTYVMMKAANNTSVSGTTAPGTKLELLDENGNVLAETVADENGNYDFGDIPGWDGTIFIIRIKDTTLTTQVVGGDKDVVIDASKVIFIPTISYESNVMLENTDGASTEWEIEASHAWTVTKSGDTSWYTLNTESGNAGISDFVVTAIGATDTYRESTLTFALNNNTFDVTIFQNFIKALSSSVVEQTEDFTEAGIADVEIVVRKANDSSIYLQTKTNANGQYTLVIEDAGEYVITAKKEGYIIATLDLHVASETTGIEKITLAKTTSPYYFNGHTYLPIIADDNYISWENAEAICQSFGGHLVSITSENENNFVNALAEKGLSNQNREWWWIGAHKENGNWAWSDGDAFEGYTNWMGEPTSDSLYGLLYSKKNDSRTGDWSNIQDNGTRYAGLICEWDYELASIEGVCSNNVKWQFTLDGTDALVISGVGVLKNSDYNTAPWKNLEYNITVVEVASGITEIDAYGLTQTYYAAEVILPDTVVTMDAYSSYIDSGRRKNYTVSADNTAFTSVDGVLFTKDMTTLIVYPKYNERTEYSVPDGVKEIQDLQGSILQTIHIPASVNSWNLRYSRFNQLEEICVDPNNSAYMSIDGVLFNKACDMLIKYPQSRVAADDTYRIPDGVTTIERRAFDGFRTQSYRYDSCGKIIFPASITTINEDNFFFDRYEYREIDLYFEGDAPLVDAYYYMNNEIVVDHTTVYYTAGKNGWTSPNWYPSRKTWNNETELTNIRIPTVLQDAYATVSGQVVDESGNPIRNVKVQGKYGDELTGVAYTDVDGKYTFQFESATTCDFRYYLSGYETVYVTSDIDSGEYSLDTVTIKPGISLLGSGTSKTGNNWTLRGTELIITCGDNNSNGVCYLSTSLYDNGEDFSVYSFWSPHDMWLIKKVTIGDGFTTLRISDIDDDLSVEELYIGADVSKIEWQTNLLIWDYRWGHTDIVIDPANTHYVITDGALYTSDYKTLVLAPQYDYSTTNYSIREGVEVVGEYAFNQSDYKTISIPNTVTTLESGSFFDCNMESIHISASVTSIGGNVFQYCNRLSTISVDSANTEYMAVDNILYNKAQTKLITVPSTRTGSLTIPDGVISIGNNAMNRTNLNRIIVPASVEKFDNHAISPDFDVKCKVYFLGNVPEVSVYSSHTYGDSELTFYYLAGKSGWSTPTTTIGHKEYNTKPFTMDELY